MPSSATQGTSFCCAIHRESPYITAGTRRCPTGSGIGAHGLGAYGPKKLRARMESAHASLNNAPSAFIWTSIFVPVMWGLSCAGAPIFDANGILAAILDTSSIVPELASQSHALALAATITSARAIEERLFREHFHDIWTVAAAPCDESRPAILLAIDHDKRIVGADRMARKTCGLDDRLLEKGLRLSTLFEENPSVVLSNDEEDVALQLVRSNDAQLWYVLITPPGLVSKRRSLLGAETHTRPRIGSLGSPPGPAILKEDAHGGLPPASIRRRRDSIHSHLIANITIDTLATTVGLSVYHFARAFKQSIGMPPHEFILRRRVQRADQMLHRTELPLSEIAAAVGFSDQSHFARHFRRQTGMTPGAARWTQR